MSDKAETQDAGEVEVGATANLTVSEEAAAINTVAEEIGQWAERMGFRDDFHDAAWLAKLADDIRSPQVADELRRIAKRHGEMAVTMKLALVHTEISEAVEGQRDGDEDNVNDELAGAMIRLLELAHARKAPIGDILLREMARNEQREHRHGRRF
jgi:hypothetical protein